MWRKTCPSAILFATNHTWRGYLAAYRKFNSVTNGDKEKTQLLMELNPKLQPIATHFTNPANLETSNLNLIGMKRNLIYWWSQTVKVYYRKTDCCNKWTFSCCQHLWTILTREHLDQHTAQCIIKLIHHCKSFINWKVIYHTVLCVTMTKHEEFIHAWSILRYYPSIHIEERQQW